MTKYDVGILGAGRMGSAFVRHFEAQGLEVAIWNRSFEKAEELASPKVTALLAVDELLNDSGLVINQLSSYENLEEILRGWQSRSAIDLLNLSTGAPGEVSGVLSLLPEGSRYLDGANGNFPQDIGSQRGFIAFAGSVQLWQEYQEQLASLCGEVFYLSEDPALSNVLDTGFVGLFEIPTMVAFIESANYMARNGISDEIVRKLVEIQARDLAPVLRQIFDERGSRASSGTASVDTYRIAGQTYLTTASGSGRVPKQLQAAQAVLVDAAAAGLGEMGIASLRDAAPES